MVFPLNVIGFFWHETRKGDEDWQKKMQFGIRKKISLVCNTFPQFARKADSQSPELLAKLMTDTVPEP